MKPKVLKKRNVVTPEQNRHAIGLLRNLELPSPGESKTIIVRLGEDSYKIVVDRTPHENR